METIIHIDQSRREVVATRNGIHSYRRAVTEAELKEGRSHLLDVMGSDC